MFWFLTFVFTFFKPVPPLQIKLAPHSPTYLENIQESGNYIRKSFENPIMKFWDLQLLILSYVTKGVWRQLYGYWYFKHAALKFILPCFQKTVVPITTRCSKIFFLWYLQSCWLNFVTPCIYNIHINLLRLSISLCLYCLMF